MAENLEKKVKIACVVSVLEECLRKRLFGEIMTIIDASISDPDSRKAVKSLSSQSFTRISKQILVELNNLKEVE
jgi:predicted kinase